MWFGIITLFPEMFEILKVGITGRAIQEQLLTLNIWNPRDFAKDKHKTVDDHPYGGGPGMVMMAEPLQSALLAAKKAVKEPAKIIHLTPQGQLFDQQAARQFAIKRQPLVFVAGRYEGIDERIITTEVDEEWSIGDYILTGGELASMVMMDAIIRHLPNAIGNPYSIAEDSLMNGLLKYPQYTRPESFSGMKVPDVLLNGNHQLIRDWRLKQSLGKTWLKRPDLIHKKILTDKEKQLLDQYIDELAAQENKP